MKMTIGRSWLGAAVVVVVGVLAWQLLPALSGQGDLPNLVTESFVQSGVSVPANDPLAKVEADVDRDYRTVRQMSAAQLAKLQAMGAPIMIFDVREKPEYDVSRIPGAVRVDPGVWSSTFLQANADRVKGKTVVFYCSVGVRSSKLAGRVQKALAAKGGKGGYNLRGGVFRWHNQSRTLEDARGKTPLVHPYDRYWGKLVNRQDYISYKPMPR